MKNEFTPQMEADDAAIKAAMHAVQTGVKALQQLDPACALYEPETSPKHLRVGVNSALIDSGVCVELLVEKGIITRAEVLAKLRHFWEKEAMRYRVKVAQKMGLPPDQVTLG